MTEEEKIEVKKSKEKKHRSVIVILTETEERHERGAGVRGKAGMQTGLTSAAQCLRQ